MNFKFDSNLQLDAYATTITFNKKGTLLAVGSNNGNVYIIDVTAHFMNGGYKLLAGHVHPITSLDFSKNGDRLISGSTDNKIVIWNMENEEREFILRFPSQVSKVQFHPEDHRQFLVCQNFRNPVYYYWIGVMHGPVPLDDSNDSNLIADFCGKHFIMTGSSRGKILLVSLVNLRVIASFKLNSPIRGFNFRENGDFLVNSDYVLRIYNLEDVKSLGLNSNLQPKKTLSNIIDKQTSWKVSCFSNDGEYICSGGKTFLYVWDVFSGGIHTILENSFQYTVLDIKWHPVLPIIISIHGGHVFIWSAHTPIEAAQNLTDFFGKKLLEIDETIEYNERESEFDSNNEDASFRDDVLNESSESLEVDVCSVDDTNCVVLDLTPKDNGYFLGKAE